MNTFNHSRRDRLFYLMCDILLGMALLAVAYPIIYIFSASFSSSAAVTSGRVWLWPVEFSLEGYKAVFSEDRIITGYMNTLLYTLVGTIINVVMTILAAFPLSRKEMPFKKVIMLMFTFTMIFSGGLIPTYLLVNGLGLTNTLWALVIPNAIGIWNVIITKSYYESNISDELYEAAQLDGCNQILFMLKIALPLTKAITAVLVLFYGVAHWNAFFDAFLYLSKKELYPLQIVLREILIMNSIDPSVVLDPELMAEKRGLAELLKYSLIIVASLPVWCAYPFIQKYFVKGVMVGAVKG